MALPNIPLSHRQRMALRYAGIALGALIVFVFALQATFPYDRIRDKAIEALSEQYDVKIGDVERGIMPGSVTFKAVSLTTRPTKPEEQATTIYLDSVHVDLGLFALIGKTASVDLDARLGIGRIKGNISLLKFGRGGYKLDLTGTDLPGKSLPLTSLVGLPVTGKLEVSIDLTLPTTKTKAGRTILDWSKADGELALGCPAGCTFGDGKTKLKPLLKNRSQQAMVGEGIEFGKLDIDSLQVEGKFTPAEGDPDAHSSGYKSGRFDVTKFDLKSKEGELHVDYMMTMAPDLNESVVVGCLRFNVNESLLKTPDGKKAYDSVSLSGAEKRSDGLFHIRLSDHLKDMKRMNLECGPNVKAEDPAHPHPTITVTPPPPPRPEPPPRNEPLPRPEPPPHPEPPVDAGAVTTQVNPANLGAGSAAPEGSQTGSEQPPPAVIP